jgi:hypothetical protein
MIYWLFFNHMSHNLKVPLGRYQFNNPNTYKGVQGY